MVRVPVHHFYFIDRNQQAPTFAFNVQHHAESPIRDVCLHNQITKVLRTILIQLPGSPQPENIRWLLIFE